VKYLIVILIIFVFSGVLIQAQNYACDPDTTRCYAEYLYPSGFPIEIEKKWESDEEASIILIPFSYDIDNDCKPEVIFESNINGEAALIIVDSQTGETILEFLIPYLISRINSFAIADVNNDGMPEVFLVTDDFGQNPVSVRDRLVSIDLEGNINWISNESCRLNFVNESDSTPSIADFNQDGIPEVYVNNQIFNSLNGNLLVEGGRNGLGGNLSITIAAQLDDNINDLELAAGYTVYKVQINNISDSIGNKMIPMNIDVDGVYYDGYTTIGDINLDGKLDVIVSSTEAVGLELLYVYSIIDNAPELIAQISPPGASTFMGTGTIGIVDESDTPVILVQRPNKMFAYQYDGSLSLAEKWNISTEDNSGTTGITLYDLNNDNINELILRDEKSLKLIDGSGTTPTLISETQCVSPTILEYPIVADIDNTGEAKICVTCIIDGVPKLVAFGSPDSLPGWTPARSIWNQYNYHILNVNDDGTIPQYMQNNATYEGGRYNSFFQQATALDSNGMHRQSASSLIGDISCIRFDTLTQSYIVTFGVENLTQASRTVVDSFPVAFYDGDPESGGARLGIYWVTDTLVPGDRVSGIQITLSGISGDQLFMVVNTDRPGGGVYVDEDYLLTECDYTDNVYTLMMPEMDIRTQTLCRGSSFDFYGSALMDAGLYYHIQSDMGGCDSIVYILTLEVQDTFLVVQDTTVCDSFVWNEAMYDATGIYESIGQSVVGCDSISKLYLTIHNSDFQEVKYTSCGAYTWNDSTYIASGNYPLILSNRYGCDSTVVLDLTVSSIDTSYTSFQTCESFTWFGQEYNTSGVYTYVTVNQYGCDSTVILDLVIDDKIEVMEAQTVCDSLVWNGQLLINDGTYTFDTVSSLGCDSLVMLDLHIYRSDSSRTTETACDSFLWNGSYYDQSGVYAFRTNTLQGCDSTAYLTLTINRSQQKTEEIGACDSILWNGVVYTTSGIYMVDTSSLYGCDSTLILDLEIYPSYSMTLADSACGSYMWNEMILTESGLYENKFTTQNGCDSIVTLMLDLRPVDSDSLYETACDSIVVNNQVLDESGMYRFDYVNSAGCDSTVYVFLDLLSETYWESAASCGTYEWSVTGLMYNTSGVYQHRMTNVYGCDSLHILDLTINQEYATYLSATTCDSSFYWFPGQMTYYASGVYDTLMQTAAGCDSFFRLNLTLLPNYYTLEEVTSSQPYLWDITNAVYDSSGRYKEEFYTTQGCDSIYVLDLTIKKLVNVYTPNILRAQGDQGTLTLFGNQIKRIESLTIYDRWGNVVFNQEDVLPGDYSSGWDGTLNGQPVVPGVYVWKAALLLEDGSIIHRTGDVTIIR
jgi:hypothetical protein